MAFSSGFAAGAQVANQQRQEALEIMRIQLLSRQLDQKVKDDYRKNADADLKALADEAAKRPTQEMFDRYMQSIAPTRRAFITSYVAAGDDPDLAATKFDSRFAFIPPEAKGKAEGQKKAAERAVPGSQPPADIITLGKGEQTFSLRKDDKRIDQLLNMGFTEVKTPVAQVNIVNESALQKSLGDEVGKQISGVIQRGTASADAEPRLMQMADLLGEGVQTGAVQPALTRLQAIAQDLGVNLEGIASRFGMKLGNVSTKEQFDRLATETIIGGFEKFKGNLNAREVQLAENAFANLGRTEEANVDAVAMALAGAQVSRERSMRAIAAATTGNPDEARKVLQEQVSGESTARIREIHGRLKGDILDRMKSAKELAGQAPAIGSIEEVQKASKEQVKLFVKKLTPEQYKALPEDVKNELKRKLSE